MVAEAGWKLWVPGSLGLQSEFQNRLQSYTRKHCLKKQKQKFLFGNFIHKCNVFGSNPCPPSSPPTLPIPPTAFPFQLLVLFFLAHWVHSAPICIWEQSHPPKHRKPIRWYIQRNLIQFFSFCTLNLWHYVEACPLLILVSGQRLWTNPYEHVFQEQSSQPRPHTHDFLFYWLPTFLISSSLPESPKGLESQSTKNWMFALPSLSSAVLQIHQLQFCFFLLQKCQLSLCSQFCSSSTSWLAFLLPRVTSCGTVLHLLVVCIRLL